MDRWYIGGLGRRATDGIERWSPEQVARIYRTFGQDFSAYTHFVFVDYNKVSTKSVPLTAYRGQHDLGLFLVAIDTSDCRHVLFGFRSEADRETFLGTPDILIARSDG